FRRDDLPAFAYPEGDEMISPFLPDGPAHRSFPADRLELIPDFLDSPLHGLVVRVDAQLAARHEPGPLAHVGLVNPLAEEGHFVLEEGEFDLEFSVATRRALREQFQ